MTDESIMSPQELRYLHSQGRLWWAITPERLKAMPADPNTIKFVNTRDAGLIEWDGEAWRITGKGIDYIRAQGLGVGDD